MNFVFLAILLSFSVLSMGNAQANDWLNEHVAVDVKAFRAESFLLDGTGTTYSGMGSWQPTFLKFEKVKAGISLGIGPMKRSTDTVSTLLESVVLVNYAFHEKLSADISGGVQNWPSTDEGTAKTFGLGLRYNISGMVKFIDDINVGYSYIDQSKSYQMIRIGLGIHF